MASQYAYLRISPKMNNIDKQLAAFSQFNPELKITKEEAKGRSPIEEREGYQSLVSTMQPDDELVIWWFTDLAKSFKQAYDILQDLLAKGIRITTLAQPLNLKPNDQQTEALLKLLLGYASVETHHRLQRAEMGRCALKEDSDRWHDKFRGRRANHEKHQQIANLLSEGKTLQMIADETETSISTVKRVKAKCIDKKHCGHGHGHGHRGKHGAAERHCGHHAKKLSTQE